MHTDSIFYEIFQTSPDIFFELIGKPTPRASTYSFVSQEVKQTRFQIDGIFVPPIYAFNISKSSGTRYKVISWVICCG